jgi:chaperonin cofactor prefoldin
VKQIFLHIGLHKTGSTSIQYFLSYNRKLLAQLGYLYPSKKLNHCYLASALKTSHKNNYSPEWEQTIEEIENSNLDKIIISSEVFVESKTSEIIDRLAEKLKDYQVKIIVYIRRQDRKIESSFTQRVKSGIAYNSLEQYLQKADSVNYWKTLKDWSKVFGIDNIIVRPLEKEQIPDLCLDFLKNIGISSFDGFVKTEDRNLKPNLAQVIAINFVNQQIAMNLNPDKQKYDRRNLRSLLSEIKYPQSFLPYTQHWKSKAKYNLIPYERALKIIENSQEQNTQIAEQFLNRKDGCLFYEPLEQYEHDSLDIAHLDRQQLIETCSYLCTIVKDYSLLTRSI